MKSLALSQRSFTWTMNTCNFEISTDLSGVMTISVHGSLVMQNSAECLRRLASKIDSQPKRVVIDLKHVDRMDDYGAMVISELKAMLGISGDVIWVINVQEHQQKMLSLADFDKERSLRFTPRKKNNFVVEIGDATVDALKGTRFFVSFIGSTALAFFQVIKRPSSLRFSDTVMHMKTTGVEALPIIGMISMLLGLIMAFMSSLQLQQYGANIYVASLVSLAMVSELGPVMTSIVVAGRSGSAYAAEISSMKIAEEIDALFIMGFDPTLFLVLPRLIAAVVVIPLLTMFSHIFAIAGGAVIGVLFMEITPETYIKESLAAITVFELVWGLFKSAVFATLIAITGCLRGFQAKGGAASVGNAATSAVVTSIFLIVLFDSIFAVIRSYWG